MSQITIDNVAYEIESLSDAAREWLANLQATNEEIRQLHVRMAIAETARRAYAAELAAALPPQTKQ